MAYDSRCYDLAVVFLSDNPEKDTEANRDELAQHIQTEIEDWIEYILKPCTSALPSTDLKSPAAPDALAPAPRPRG